MSSPFTERSRYFRIPPERIALARALVEAHEGVAVMRSPGADEGEIELLHSASCADEVEALVSLLVRETGLVEIRNPGSR